ncbi:hypothetical protein [Escherichia coli]
MDGFNFYHYWFDEYCVAR